jgi:hypothetical protein
MYSYYTPTKRVFFLMKRKLEEEDICQSQITERPDKVYRMDASSHEQPTTDFWNSIQDKLSTTLSVHYDTYGIQYGVANP